MAAQWSIWEYARCIDCRFFGQQGAHCDIKAEQRLCFEKACVFFQWKNENVLRHMAPIYFWPHPDAQERAEMRLRGMEATAWT